jgi:hypothetical protein
MSTRIVALAFVLCPAFLVINPARADSIVSLASVGTVVDSGQSTSAGATIAIAPNTGWASALPGSSWVSFSSTGDTSGAGFVSVPNGSVISFFDVFDLSGTAIGGSLTVMADDSATVLLNGVTLMAEATSIGNTYSTCSDFGIGCILPTTINVPSYLLNSGANTLEFQVAQRAGSSFGLDYLGSVIDLVDTLEPASGLMFGLGLLALSAIVWRRGGQQV